MDELEQKYNLLENGEFEIKTALKVITKKENVFIRLLKTLKKFIFGVNGKDENVPY